MASEVDSYVAIPLSCAIPAIRDDEAIPRNIQKKLQ